MDGLLRRAIATYGIKNQEDVAIEEMSELTKALMKMHRYERSGKGNYYGLRMNIFEEIADVEIMLEQLKIIYDCKEATEAVKSAKLYRLEKRLNMGEFERRLMNEKPQEAEKTKSDSDSTV